MLSCAGRSSHSYPKICTWAEKHVQERPVTEVGAATPTLVIAHPRTGREQERPATKVGATPSTIGGARPGAVVSKHTPRPSQKRSLRLQHKPAPEGDERQQEWAAARAGTAARAWERTNPRRTSRPECLDAKVASAAPTSEQTHPGRGSQLKCPSTEVGSAAPTSDIAHPRKGEDKKAQLRTSEWQLLPSKPCTEARIMPRFSAPR